ncbi:MAG: cytochrome c [Paracoccaceae bacterium]
MKKFYGFAAFAVVAAGFAGWTALAQSASDETLLRDDPQTLALGETVYGDNCAACHGAALEGEENWRQPNPDGTMPAPPHDASGHTWHHDAEALFALTKYGVGAVIGDTDYASNMPAYEDMLTDAEIIAVLSYIRSTWPDDIRTMYDARELDR